MDESSQICWPQSRLNSVAYRGQGPAIQDLIAGHVDSACMLAPAIVPHVQAGKVRALMGASLERAALTPDTPSAREANCHYATDKVCRFSL